MRKWILAWHLGPSRGYLHASEQTSSNLLLGLDHRKVDHFELLSLKPTISTIINACKLSVVMHGELDGTWSGECTDPHGKSGLIKLCRLTSLSTEWKRELRDIRDEARESRQKILELGKIWLERRTNASANDVDMRICYRRRRFAFAASDGTELGPFETTLELTDLPVKCVTPNTLRYWSMCFSDEEIVRMLDTSMLIDAVTVELNEKRWELSRTYKVRSPDADGAK